jgi:hypothetical protein
VYSALCISREWHHSIPCAAQPSTYDRRKQIWPWPASQAPPQGKSINVYQSEYIEEPRLTWLNRTHAKQLNYAGRPFYQLGIAGFKASLCLSYLRLLSGTSKSLYRIVIWVVIVISTIGHIVGTLVLLLDCSPVGISTLL